MAVRRTFRPPQHEFSCPMVQLIAALGKARLKGFLGQGAHCQERWCGQVTSCISWHPALAPALAVKIDAAPFQKFDPVSQTSYLVELGAARTTPPPRRLLTQPWGPPLGLNSNIFLKPRINYSASRASENGM